MDKKKNILYLAYDGMTDPLGQSQVLSYLVKLSEYGYNFHIISFEKEAVFEKRKQKVEAIIKDSQITWHPLKYHKNPPIFSTIYDINQAWKLIKKLEKNNHFDIVHSRGYTLSSLGVKMKKKFGTKFIFDMRGWWPDEKLESGLWESPIFKIIYRFFKAQEKQFFKEADLAVSLTHVGKKTIINLGLKNQEQIHVIPTCVNFDVFKPFNLESKALKRKALNIPMDSKVFLYSGSVGTNYRTDLVIKFFKHLLEKEPDAFFVFLSHADHNIIWREIEKSGLPKEKFRITSSTYDEVGENLMVGDAGLIMYDDGFSVIGRSPTKLGEYWASGLPCISAKGIGDLEKIVETYPNTGILIENLNEEGNYQKAIDLFLQSNYDKETLRKASNDYFSLENGVKKYAAIYEKVFS